MFNPGFVTSVLWLFCDFKDFPAVQWKLMNVERLIVENPKKHLAQIALLRAVL
jgi:hypothetical protein